MIVNPMQKFILGNMFASLAAPSLTESMILPELNVEGHFFLEVWEGHDSSLWEGRCPATVVLGWHAQKWFVKVKYQRTEFAKHTESQIQTKLRSNKNWAETNIQL